MEKVLELIKERYKAKGVYRVPQTGTLVIVKNTEANKYDRLVELVETVPEIMEYEVEVLTEGEFEERVQLENWWDLEVLMNG